MQLFRNAVVSTLLLSGALSLAARPGHADDDYAGPNPFELAHMAYRGELPGIRGYATLCHDFRFDDDLSDRVLQSAIENQFVLFYQQATTEELEDEVDDYASALYWQLHGICRG
jgi:hypothetical protein